MKSPRTHPDHASAPSPDQHAWPALPLDPWRDTQETLHLWTQIVGKVRLALAPQSNHWWSVALYLTPRGLTTGVMYHPRGPLEIAFDFVEHALHVDSGTSRSTLRLEPRSVADFHSELVATLGAHDRRVTLHGSPNEVVEPIPFERDNVHASYDADAVQCFQRALRTADRLTRAFATRFLGKQSPSHFFWGSFDLAMTRFSGRGAPPHPGGIPSLPDWATREAYSHECASFGWWPGNGPFGRASFYAYAYPSPDGFDSAANLPPGAYFTPELAEYVFPWEDARSAADPDAAVLQFFQAVYEQAATLGDWDRAALDRDPTSLDAAAHRFSHPLLP